MSGFALRSQDGRGARRRPFCSWWRLSSTSTERLAKPPPPAVFADAGVPTEGPPSGDPWLAFRRKVADDRKRARDCLLRRTAARQGTGDLFYALDAARLLAALQPTRQSCEVAAEFPGTASELEDDARRVFRFVDSLRPGPVSAALDARRDRLAEWGGQTRQWLGDSFDKRVLVDDAVALANAAKNLGAFPATLSYDTLKRHAELFRDAAVTDALEKAARLTEGAKPGTVLTALVQVPDDAVRAADTFRTGLDEFVRLADEAARKKLREILRLAGIVPAEEIDLNDILKRAADQLDTDLGKLAAVVAELAEPAAALCRVPPEGRL